MWKKTLFAINVIHMEGSFELFGGFLWCGCCYRCLRSLNASTYVLFGVQLKQSRSSCLFVREENFSFIANRLDVNCQDGHQDGDFCDVHHFVINGGRKGHWEAGGMVPELGLSQENPYVQNRIKEEGKYNFYLPIL